MKRAPTSCRSPPSKSPVNDSNVQGTPTYQKWVALAPGEELWYQCRRFVKSEPEHEERLFRRIDLLQKRNAKYKDSLEEKRRAQGLPVNRFARPRPARFPEDETHIWNTPTFRKWSSLAAGDEMEYNSKRFCKGKPGDEERLIRRIFWGSKRSRKKPRTRSRNDAEKTVEVESEGVEQENSLSADDLASADIVEGEKSVDEKKQSTRVQRMTETLVAPAAVIPTPAKRKRNRTREEAIDGDDESYCDKMALNQKEARGNKQQFSSTTTHDVSVVSVERKKENKSGDQQAEVPLRSKKKSKKGRSGDQQAEVPLRSKKNSKKGHNHSSPASLRWCTPVDQPTASLPLAPLPPTSDLWEAAVQGDLELVKWHLETVPFHLNATRDGRGDSAIIIACCRGHFDIVCYLLQQPTLKINLATHKSGATALHSAVQQNHVNIVCELLKHPNILVNLQDYSHGWSALHFASVNNRVQIVHILLNHPHIDVSLCDHKGQTALDIATQHKQEQIRDLLELTASTTDHIKKVPTARAASNDQQSSNTEMHTSTSQQTTNVPALLNEKTSGREKSVMSEKCKKALSLPTASSSTNNKQFLPKQARLASSVATIAFSCTNHSGGPCCDLIDENELPGSDDWELLRFEYSLLKEQNVSLLKLLKVQQNMCQALQNENQALHEYLEQHIMLAQSCGPEHVPTRNDDLMSASNISGA